VTGRIHIRPLADREIDDIALHIAGGDRKAGQRFLVNTFRAFDKLLAMPMMGGAVPSHPPQFSGLRRWSVPGFKKYLIFYRPVEDGIEVVRVLHGARDVLTALTEE
jgi:toxin ParE1/3/4